MFAKEKKTPCKKKIYARAVKRQEPGKIYKITIPAGEKDRKSLVITIHEE